MALMDCLLAKDITNSPLALLLISVVGSRLTKLTKVAFHLNSLDSGLSWPDFLQVVWSLPDTKQVAVF